jgi:CRISPR-associated protein Cas5h
MRIFKFRLQGKTGFFKKPDVNSYFYFTYGNIHKVALLGVFGAILGYKGYNQMNSKDVFPEFYEKLKDIKISIIPDNDKGVFNKKVQVFNNSVGYASKELGGNLIVKEQWLETPSWDIYFIVDNLETETLANYLLENKAVYTPYLGKNDHYADISDVRFIDAFEIATNVEKINCLCLKSLVNVKLEENFFEDEEDFFKYEELLPIALDTDTNMYLMESFIYTNMNVNICNNYSVYMVDEKNIVFY